jgi:linoleoyl-CoA desaturase
VETNFADTSIVLPASDVAPGRLAAEAGRRYAPANATADSKSSGPEDLLMVNPGGLYTEANPEFYMEMRRRIDQWFRDRGLPKTAPRRQIVKGFSCLAIAIVAYLLIITRTVPRWTMLPLCLVSGMSMFIFAMSFAHDACHGAMSTKGRFNRLWAFAYDLAGVSSYITNGDHMSGHHRAPNVSGIDVAVGSDVEPTFRLHPDVPHRWFHRYQHLYFPIAYALSTLHKWFILDYTGMAQDRFGLRSGRRSAARNIAFALCFKAFTLLWAVVIPVLVMHLRWWELVLGILSFHLVPGLLVGLTFQLTHISDGNAFPSLSPDGRLHTSRALHTLETNLDIMPQSRWLNAFSCGLTLHVSHHLFPEIAHTYLPDIAPIIEQTAAAYGVRYRKQPSISKALVDHYQLLKRFGRPPDRSMVQYAHPIG